MYSQVLQNHPTSTPLSARNKHASIRTDTYNLNPNLKNSNLLALVMAHTGCHDGCTTVAMHSTGDPKNMFNTPLLCHAVASSHLRSSPGRNWFGKSNAHIQGIWIRFEAACCTREDKNRVANAQISSGVMNYAILILHVLIAVTPGCRCNPFYLLRLQAELLSCVKGQATCNLLKDTFEAHIQREFDIQRMDFQLSIPSTIK